MNNFKFDQQLFNALLADAEKSPRKRSHRNIHSDLNEPVQRLCIGLKKGTYIRPHYHQARNKWELMLVLNGSVAYCIFDAKGVLLEKITIGAGESTVGIEIPPKTWHTLLPITEDAVIFEVKEGPFTPSKPSDFASWAPAEGEPAVTSFLDWLADALPGDSFAE